MPSDPDIHCSPEEGARFREGVYRPLDLATLPDAPRDGSFPEPEDGPPFYRVDEVPRVPRLRHMIGPSVIALGMGLGAGEFLLWPNLIAVNGFSIWWLFWVGVVTQFIVIGEIERWSLATGESIFAGMGRMTRRPFWPWFFLVATLVSFFWPGWAAESADFTREAVNALAGREAIADWQPIALAMLAFIWAALALSRIVYNALETFEIALVLIFFPLLFLALVAAGVLPSDVASLAKGAVSIGSVPPRLLAGDQFPTLLIAVAYAGSGGTLLLAQSLWVRDKGFAMSAFQGRIAGIRGRNEPLEERGFAFSTDHPVAVARFRRWMGLAEKELFWTFAVLIILSVVITTLLVASTIGTGRADLAGSVARPWARSSPTSSSISPGRSRSPRCTASRSSSRCSPGAAQDAALEAPRHVLGGRVVGLVLRAEQVSRSVLEHGLGLTGPVVTSITLHPVRLAAYGAWLGSLGWLVWRTARPGLLHRSR